MPLNGKSVKITQVKSFKFVFLAHLICVELKDNTNYKWSGLYRAPDATLSCGGSFGFALNKSQCSESFP